MKASLTLIVASLFWAMPVFTHAQKLSTDKEKLHGVWKVVKAQDNDKSEDAFLGTLLKFDGTTILQYKETVSDEDLMAKLSFTLDSTKDPKEINLYGYRNEKKIEVPRLGIFAFEKDQLKLSWLGDRRGKLRPANFEIDGTDKTIQQISLLLERVKPEKKR